MNRTATTSAPSAPIPAAPHEPRYARRANGMKASEIRELLKVLNRPGIISFGGGIPDPALFPAEEAKAAYSAILSDPVNMVAGLQYSVSEGYEPLRVWIADHMKSLGVPASPDNIVITSGSQQALEFLGKLFLSEHDTALVEAPTYLGALQAFSAYEPRYDTLTPEHGNRTPASYRDAAKAAGGSVKFLYVVPDFANPTGETLTRTARDGLISLAEELDAPILEDTAYSALRFEGEPVACIQAIDVVRNGGDLNRSRVIYCGTFSKTLTPGLRIGWGLSFGVLVAAELIAADSGLGYMIKNARELADVDTKDDRFAGRRHRCVDVVAVVVIDEGCRVSQHAHNNDQRNQLLHSSASTSAAAITRSSSSPSTVSKPPSASRSTRTTVGSSSASTR